MEAALAAVGVAVVHGVVGLGFLAVIVLVVIMVVAPTAAAAAALTVAAAVAVHASGLPRVGQKPNADHVQVALADVMQGDRPFGPAAEVHRSKVAAAGDHQMAGGSQTRDGDRGGGGRVVAVDRDRRAFGPKLDGWKRIWTSTVSPGP